MNAKIPMGYLKTDKRLSASEAIRLREAWEFAYKEWQRTGVPPVLSDGLEYRVIERDIIPDAFCVYCGLVNFSTSVWCQGCGAGMVRV